MQIKEKCNKYDLREESRERVDREVAEWERVWGWVNWAGEDRVYRKWENL